jgi:hypothetical protein
MDRWPINPRRIVILAGVIVLILMLMDFNARLEELNTLRRQAAIVSTQATQVMQTQFALQTEVAFAGSDQVVHEWARSEGHYMQPGDKPIVPVGVPGATPELPVTPMPNSAPMTNWQVWWNLFFGE